MSGGSQHNPNGRQPQLGPAWSPLQLQMASYLARAPAHLAPERGVTWHTPTPPHLYHVPAPSPPDPLQAMKMGSAATNSVFRHSATPPDLYRHTPTPPDKHRRHTPSPGDPKASGLAPTDLFSHLGSARDKVNRPDDLLSYSRSGVDLSVTRPSNGAPLVVRDAPTINSLIARSHRPAPRVDQLLERLAPPPSHASSVIVTPRPAASPTPTPTTPTPTPTSPTTTVDDNDCPGKRKRKPEKTSRRPPAHNGDCVAREPERTPVEPTPPPADPPDETPPPAPTPAPEAPERPPEPAREPTPPAPKPTPPAPEPKPVPEPEPAPAEPAEEADAPTTTSFVEVENQLEKMFAGIEEERPPPAPEEPPVRVTATRGRGGGRRGRGRKKAHAARRGPYVAVRGPRESPASVCVVNAGAEEEGERRAPGPVRARGPHRSTLGAKYDARTADATWVCAFCGRGPHHNGAGDLFGPYAGGAGGVGGGGETDEVWTHEECAVWAPGVLMAGSRAWGLWEGVSRAGAVRCDACGGCGAALACSARGCVSRAHVVCARAAGWTLHDHTFRAYCRPHGAAGHAAR